MDSNKLRASLRLHEAEKLKMYQDQMGNWTVGVGHNMSDKPISSRASAVILDDDINDVITDLTKTYSWFPSLDDVRQRALIDMCFNLGLGGLMKSPKMLDALSKGQWQVAHDEALNGVWAKEVGQRAVTDALQFLTGKD